MKKVLNELQDVGALSNNNLSFLTAYHFFEEPNLQKRQSAMNANSQKKIIFSLSLKKKLVYRQTNSRILWPMVLKFPPWISHWLITYYKVASSNTSRLEAKAGFFRLLMKGFLILMYCDLLTKTKTCWSLKWMVDPSKLWNQVPSLDHFVF